MQKQGLTVKNILLSLAGFVLFWAALSDAWGYSSHIDSAYGSYLYAYLSRLVWVSPALWLIIRFPAFLRYDKKTLFSRPVLNRSMAAVLAAVLVFCLVSMFLVHKGFRLNASAAFLPEMVKMVMVGFAEETVFRGWGYNALSKAAGEKKAVFFSTLFFILLHWPAYFIRLYRFGTLDIGGLLAQSLAALVWGYIFCYLLKKGKTVWNPVIVHTIYDVMCILLAG